VLFSDTSVKFLFHHHQVQVQVPGSSFVVDSIGLIWNLISYVKTGSGSGL
jgi:hypothetical protein